MESKRIEDMEHEAEVALDQVGAVTYFRITISSGSGEDRLRQAIVMVLPKFGQTDLPLKTVRQGLQALERWAKERAPDRTDWIVMPFEYLNHFPGHPPEEAQ